MPLAADAGVEGSHAPARQPEAARWDACLALRFERVGPRSVLAQREHRGPLVVQKALYPEGPGVCQCVIVHPPAGIVGGDRIRVSVDGARILDESLAVAERIWSTAIEDYFERRLAVA